MNGPRLRTLSRLSGVAIIGAALSSCGPGDRQAPRADRAAADAARPLRLVDAAPSAGLDFRHRATPSGEYFIIEPLGAGAAAFDCDGDGDLDLLLRQSGRLPGPSLPPDGLDRLYRNVTEPGGSLRFVDVTAGSGLEVPAYGQGVATGDYDDDGRVDLYLTNFGSNRLLRGRGDCRFEETTARAGVDDSRWSTAASFFDADRDGDLDLFVGNYLGFDRARHKSCFQATGAPDYCGPEAYEAVPDRFFRNRGDGTFEDATLAAGLASTYGKTLGSVAADFDGDGWGDLFVANDSTDNLLWHNRGDGTFEERARISGCALNSAGLRTGDMGVDASDFDGDGDFDLVSTHLSVEGVSLWRNDGTGAFWDSAAATGSLAATLGLTGFGVAWYDPDLDGWLDLFVANGGVRYIDRLARQGPTRTLEQRNVLLRNRSGRYEILAAQPGEVLALEEVSRGVVVADFDDDGDSDLLVTNNDGPVRLLLTDGRPAPEDWIGLRLALSNGSDALGAEARLRFADGSVELRRVHTDGSYLSASEPRISFGLRGHAAPAELLVRWPRGTEEGFAIPEHGRYTTLREGGGTPVRRPS